MVWHSDISDGIARTILRILLAFFVVNNCDLTPLQPLVANKTLHYFTLTKVTDEAAVYRGPLLPLVECSVYNAANKHIIRRFCI